jgi:uncharacterized protein YbcI
MSDGSVRATIATEITRLQAEYYGRGPTKARTYINDDLVVVVLEETFTPAEKTLIARGESEGIQDIRRRSSRPCATSSCRPSSRPPAEGSARS